MRHKINSPEARSAAVHLERKRINEKIHEIYVVYKMFYKIKLILDHV